MPILWLTMRSVGIWGMALEGNKFSKLLEGDEVERFLSAFVLPEDVRKDAQNRAPDVQFPENTDDVLRDVKSIWEKKGFLSPAELRAELIGKYTPNSDATIKKFITDIELSRNTPETVTGYLSKEHAYVTTGLGHLYAEETGKPIAMAEVDFSNMGGTNKEFERRIAAERGIPVQEVNPKEAERMTDQAVKLLSDSMTSSLGGELPEGAKIVPIRTGGDELRLIFTGIEDPAQLEKITDKMHSHIEHHVAGMGLQDHSHLKDPTNPVRNGFGAAIAIQDMRQINSPSTITQGLDERIKTEKERIGNLRLGQIDNVVMTQQIETALQKGLMTIPEGMDKADYVSTVLGQEGKKVKRFSDVLHSRNPVHNPELVGGVTGFKAYIEAATLTMAESPLVSRPVPQAFANDNYAAENRPQQISPMASLDERRTAIAKSNFEGSNVQLSPTDNHFLKQSIRNLTPIDPSAQVMMPKDMVALTEVYAAEAEEFRAKFDPSDPDTVSGLKKAGLSSVSEIYPRAMAVSFHNLAGLNNALGHHNADLVLRHMGTGIIEGSLDKAGIKSSDGKKPYTIAHHGGGNFSVLLDPVAEDGDGKQKFISQNTVAEIETEIGRQVADLNEQPVDKFLEERGVPIDDNMRSVLTKEGIATFANIRDPKDRALSTNENVKGRVNGIHVAVASEVVMSGPNELKGDAFIARIRTQADVNLTALRDNKIISQDMAAIEAKKIEPTDLEVLKRAGNWMIGVSDQANGGFKPAITVSIDGKDPDEIAQIKKVLTKLADQENGTRVIDGSAERGLTHPTTNSRKTISLEGGIGLKGIEDIMRASDVLKQSGAGHFEWDDDVRDWRNSTQGKSLSQIEPRNFLVSETPAAPTRPTAAPAKSEPSHAAPPSEKKTNAGIRVVETVADLEGLDPDKRVFIKAGVLDGIAKAASAHSNSTVHEGRSHVGGAGVGVGMGVYGLTQKLGADGSAAADLKNRETRNLATSGIVADATAVFVDGADGLESLKKASKGLQTASKVSRVAAPVGVALSVASGAIDYKIAAKQGDGARAADAVGGTAGGIAGAAVGGVAGAKAGALAGASVGAFFGGVGAVPGAAIGGFIGGLVGAVGGAFVGAEAGKKVAEVTIKDSLQNKFDEERRNNNSQPKTAAPSALRSELKAESKIELKPDEPERFAKSAPDLGKAFKASADPNSAPNLAANEPKFKGAANNLVYIAHGI